MNLLTASPFSPELAERIPKIAKSCGWVAGLQTDDLVQTAWLAVLEAAQAGDPLDDESLNRAIRAKLRRAVRSEYRHTRKRVYVDQLDTLPSGNPQAPDASPQLSVLARAVARLPKEERRVVRSRYDFGANWRTIAEMMGIPDRCVKEIHRQALQRLQRALVRDGIGRDLRGRAADQVTCRASARNRRAA